MSLVPVGINIIPSAMRAIAKYRLLNGAGRVFSRSWEKLVSAIFQT